MEPVTEQTLLSKLRVLWTFIRPHRKTLGFGLLLALVASATGLAMPMATKWVLDTLNSSGSMVNPLALLVVLLVISTFVWYRQMVLLGTMAERVVLDARESMVRRFFRVKIGALTGHPTGELVTRVTSDTVLLREAASSSVIGMINNTVVLIGCLVLMAVLDIVLLGVALAAVMVVVALVAKLMPAIAKAQERAQEAVGNLGGDLEGSLRAIRTVKASRAEDRQADKIMASAEESARHSIHAVKTAALAWTFAGSGIQLAVIVVLGFGAWRVSQGLLEVSALIAFLLYVFQLMEPITQLTGNVTSLQSGIAAAARIQHVQGLDVEESDVSEATSRLASPASEGPVLVMEGVTAAYGPEQEPAVRNIDLEIPRRGHTAIVGPSGAGKTTLFSLILRFLEPQEGRLLIDGQPYSELSHRAIRSRLAYVEQETPTVPGTIRDNLLFTHPDATDAEIRAALRAVQLEEKIDSLAEGLDTSLVSSPISGGQRQRIALARAMLRPADVLLLDEATAQVDGLTEAAIAACIRELSANGAVITIAHRLSTVIDADTILVMEDGRIRARGSHTELLATDDLYRQLVEALRIASATPDPVAA
jgi:ABC-type multidrug transport system fused ATPase/permease subunit